MSSTNFSFSDLSDLESVADDSRLKDALKELEDVKQENFELTRTVRELREKVKELTVEPEVKLSFEDLKTSLSLKEDILTSSVGSWSIVSSIGMEEYLERWKPSDLSDAIFRVGTQNIAIENDTVTLHESIGTREHFKAALKLGEKAGNMLVFLEDNVLVWVAFRSDGDEYVRVERFVKDGRLFVVAKRFGMKCTRIYAKDGAKSEKDSEAAKRVVELETELKEKNEDNEVLRDALGKMTEERTRDKDELEKLTEELEKAKVDVQEMASVKDSMVRKLLLSEDALREKSLETKALKAEVEEKKEELKLLAERLNEKEDDHQANSPIETAIVGKWKLKSSSPERKTTDDFTIDYSIKDGNLVELLDPRPLAETRTVIWPFNDPTHGSEAVLAHTFVKNNQIVTTHTWKKGGSFWYSTERSVEKNLLTKTDVYNNGKKSIDVFERVV